MSVWRQLNRGLRVLTNRAAADRDAADETQHYLEQAIAAFTANGLSPDEAKRAALKDLGGVTAVREQVRSYGWENTIGTLFGDLRYAARRLRQRPGFTAISALTLALGIGASTAIFSAVNPILFEPLPYPHANRIMMIWDVFESGRSDVTFHTYRELIGRNHTFDSLAVFWPWQPAMTGAGRPERFDGQSVSAGYFHTLGVSPALGRDFRASDDQFHGAKVAILSDALWRQQFGADETIVGRQIVLDGALYRVVGVMPRTFENIPGPSARIWTTLQYDDGHVTDLGTREWGHHLRMIGRLRAGVQMVQARQDLNAIARTAIPEFPRARWASLNNGFILDSLQDDAARGIKPALLAIISAVILVLLIACVNVTNLLLAQAAQRRGEFAMRIALGAARARLIRQLLAESLSLSIVGGALGMIVAEAGVRILVALGPANLPRLAAVGVNGAVFAFALGVTTLTGLGVGLFPALQASHSNPHEGAKQISRRTAGGHQVARRALVVTEVALAFVLLVSAGLLLRSLDLLFAVSPGFKAAHVITMQVQTSARRFDDDTVRHRFFEEALGAVRHVPGVSIAGFTSLLPLSGEQYGVYGASFEHDSPGGGRGVFRYVVTPGYFDAMGIEIRRGRALEEHDGTGAPLSVVISESLAKSRFSGQDPIGQRVHVGPLNRPWYVIVGVAANVKQTSLAQIDPEAVYITPAQSWFADDAMSLVVRTHGDAAAIAPALKSAIWSVDKDQAIVRTVTMENLLSQSESERRFVLILFEAFGLAALLLAATGIYGVLSGGVNERIREIGIRSALGASRSDILALVVRQGMTLSGLGVAIGLAGAIAASEAIVTLLFGVSRLDPMTYIGMIVLLLAVSALACWVPAWRASRIDPSIALSAE